MALGLGAPTRMEGQAPHPRIVWDEVDESITPGTWDRVNAGHEIERR